MAIKDRRQPRGIASAKELSSPEGPRVGAENEAEGNRSPPYDEDLAVVYRVIFAAEDPFVDHARRVFRPEDIDPVLCSDPRVAARLSEVFPDPELRRHWLYSCACQIDYAFANALAAVRKISKGAPTQFIARCHRINFLTNALLAALSEPGAADWAAVSYDFIWRGGSSRETGPGDAEMVRTLQQLAAQLMHARDGHAAARIDTAGTGRVLVERAATLLPTEAIAWLRFIGALARRAKQHPPPDTPRGNKDNFERAFLRTLFNDLLQIIDRLVAERVTRDLLPARNRALRPEGLATRLVTEFIRIGAERIPPRLAPDGQSPPATDWRHYAIAALDRAARLGGFAVASRVKQVRADRRAAPVDASLARPLMGAAPDLSSGE
jgi:hypothetical protein